MSEHSTLSRWLDRAVADPSLGVPRKNGELIFEEPWEAKAFGIAVALRDAGAYPWTDFTQHLAEQLAAVRTEEDFSYYDHWVAALEALLLSRGLLTAEALRKSRLDVLQRHADDLD